MNLSWNLIIAVGIFTKLIFGIKAPGTLILKITYRMDPITEGSGQAELYSAIRTGDIILYNNMNQLKSNENYKERLETTISFEVNNISALLIYYGRLQILNNKMGNYRTTEFPEASFQFRITNSDAEKVYPMTFYSSNSDKELVVLITGECQKNFYPQFQCSVMCIESENTQQCTEEGKKICKKGYFFNNQSQTCDIDWCWNAAFGCQNKGNCTNKKKEFVCACPPTHTGKHCEKYVDLCENSICSNGTACAIKNQKIVCLTITSQKSTNNLNVSSFKNISIQTLIVIMVFLIIMIITTAVTIWACQTPAKRKSRSVEPSINSGHSYYPCNSLNKISASCLYCNHNLHRCSCTRNPYMDNKHYYSLKPSDNRIIRSWSRAKSDILISNLDKQLSVSTLTQDDETLPLPPPVDCENTEDTFML